MTIANRFGIAFLLIAAALPYASAQVSARGESSCKGDDFWFDEKKCCLPLGGPHSHHEPPAEKQCPHEWSWSEKHSHCIPHYPRPPPPRCSKDWDWSPASFCCERSPHYPHPPHPEPSGVHHDGWKRGGSEHHGKSECKKDEFWFNEKECCLPLGGPHWHHVPPPHKQCPPDWSWSTKHSHCVPHHPHHPPPRCAKDWNWSPASFCCERSPHHPKPSDTVNHHGEWKRSSHMSRALQLCPKGLSACPIAVPSGLTGDYECLDTAHELESCGGCASTGEGQDCTAIRGIWNVGCVQGRCAVYTCAFGYKRSRDGKSCVPL